MIINSPRRLNLLKKQFQSIPEIINLSLSVGPKGLSG